MGLTPFWMNGSFSHFSVGFQGREGEVKTASLFTQHTDIVSHITQQEYTIMKPLFEIANSVRLYHSLG